MDRRAHHAFAAEFDVNKPLTLKGSLIKWEMVNPHSWFHVAVKEPDGKVTEWLIEGGSPNQLIRMGVTKNTVPIGTELTIEGVRQGWRPQSRGQELRAPDGSRLFLGGSAPVGRPATRSRSIEDWRS